MSQLGAQLLALAMSHLPDPFKGNVDLEALQHLGPGMAAAARIGLECRLSAGDGRIDVSQQLRRNQGGPQLLLDLAAGRALAGSSSAEGALWTRLESFARAWAEDSPAARAIREIWIEQDMPRPGPSRPPSLFVGLGGHLLDEAQAALLFLEHVAPDLVGAWHRVRAALETAGRFGLKPGIVLGTMFSRDGELRTSAHIGRNAQVLAFLRHVGWPGDASAVQETIAELLTQDLDLRLALGFDPELLPNCGIEIVFAAGEGRDARRKRVLEWLVSRGLAAPDLAEALEEWRGPIRQCDAPDLWPDALTAGGLFDRSGGAFVLSRFVNHLKIGFAGGGPVLSKAYLGLVLSREGVEGR